MYWTKRVKVIQSWMCTQYPLCGFKCFFFALLHLLSSSLILCFIAVCARARDNRRRRPICIHTSTYAYMYEKKFTSWVKLQTTHCSFHSVYFNWTTITDLVVSCCCCGCSCVWLFFCSFTSVLARTHTRAHISHTSCRRILCFFVRSLHLSKNMAIR